MIFSRNFLLHWIFRPKIWYSHSQAFQGKDSCAKSGEFSEKSFQIQKFMLDIWELYHVPVPLRLCVFAVQRTKNAGVTQSFIGCLVLLQRMLLSKAEYATGTGGGNFFNFFFETSTHWAEVGVGAKPVLAEGWKGKNLKHVIKLTNKLTVVFVFYRLKCLAIPEHNW